MSDTSQPIAGWYPDPENPAAERWWDGASWSDHRRPSTVAPAAPAPAPGGFAAPGPSAAAAPGYTAAGVAPYGTPAYPAPGTTSPYGAPAYAAPTPSNGLAIVGLVLALVSIVIGGVLAALAGGIVSIVALVRANRMRADGVPGDRRGMAIAGIICGFALAVISIVITVVFVAYILQNPSQFSSGSFTTS